MTDPLPADTLNALPASAKLVLKTLEYDGPLSQSELAAETYLVERTVRYACDRLETQGLIESWNDPADQRRTMYDAKTPER